jgi:DNA polymerase I
VSEINQSVLIVDGHAMAYRAFYGVRELSTEDGQPTNALFGFIRMLRQLEAQWKPDRTVVTFDGGSPASRLEKCPDYKAQRSPMPDELRSQFALLNEFLRVADIRNICIQNQEADDVIATLAERAAAEGALVRMATSDKDLMQLVNAQVHMVPPNKASEELDVDGVLNKTGVRPDQIVEWLALIGDVADNIPGVQGIGPKTATKLLSEFGTLEECYAKAEQLKSASVREKLLAGRSTADLNIELMTLDRNVPGVPEWNEIKPSIPDPEGLKTFFEKYELHRLAAELEKSLRTRPRTSKPAADAGGDQMSLF